MFTDYRQVVRHSETSVYVLTLQVNLYIIV